jgi:hypothetical protein
MITSREYEPSVKREVDENTPMRPTLIRWNVTKKDKPNMVRTHSISSTVQEILSAVAVEDSQDVVQINLIGDPSSGKTTLAKTLGHLIHKNAKIPFSVRVFTKDDLLNFAATLKTLEPANYVLIFDDLSFLKANASAKQIEMVKQAVTEIRHLPGGQDVKIVIIKNFHYTLGLDKYLRQNDFTYFTSVGSSEDDNIEGIVGRKNMGKVHYFQKIRNRIKIAPEGKKLFSYPLLRYGPAFVYKYKNPFIPLLYFNGNTLRHIVSPTREWIDPICSICATYGSKDKILTEIDLPKFKEQVDDKYGESTVKRAALNILMQNGITTDRPKVVSAERFLKHALDKKQINLNDLASAFEIEKNTVHRTYTKSKVEEFLENSKKDGVTNGDTGIP